MPQAAHTLQPLEIHSSIGGDIPFFLLLKNYGGPLFWIVIPPLFCEAIFIEFPESPYCFMKIPVDSRVYLNSNFDTLRFRYIILVYFMKISLNFDT